MQAIKKIHFVYCRIDMTEVIRYTHAITCVYVECETLTGNHVYMTDAFFQNLPLGTNI